MAKPSLPTTTDDRARAYLGVLFEIAARLRFLQSLKGSTSPYGISREICYLQLRHICELVAIGCIVIQGDYISHKTLKGEYNPQAIFKSMDKLYEGSFPQPYLMTTAAHGGHIYQFNHTPNAMTRQEMEILWGKTGNYLHRLKIEHFFRPEQQTDSNIWAEIDPYIDKLKTLLSRHGVPMHKPKIMVLGELHIDGGNPTITFLEYKGQSMEVHQFTGQGETAYWRS